MWKYISLLLLTLSTTFAKPASLQSRNKAFSISSKLGPVVDLGYAVRTESICQIGSQLTLLVRQAYIGNSSYPGVTFYGGIPYIQPPLNNLRWRAPRQLDESPKNGDEKPVIDARNFGPICVQQPAVVGVGMEGAQLFAVPYKLDAKPSFTRRLRYPEHLEARKRVRGKQSAGGHLHSCGCEGQVGSN
jgi:hypothetical protein